MVDKQPFDMEGTSVTAEIFTNTIVEVTGPPDVVCENNKIHLRRYFKNKRSNGGPVKDIVIIEPGICRIRFSTEEGNN